MRSVTRTKDALARETECARVSILAKAGTQFDVDSMKEIAAVFRTEGLRDRLDVSLFVRRSLNSLLREMTLRAPLRNTDGARNR